MLKLQKKRKAPSQENSLNFNSRFGLREKED